MLYIFLTILSGCFSGLLALWFRLQEIKHEVILMHKQLFSQILLFIVFGYIFGTYFSEISIQLGFIELSWFLIYVLFSSASFYAIQVFFESFTGKLFFASEEEMEKYLEKLEDENKF